jgi:hypothetical protein
MSQWDFGMPPPEHHNPYAEPDDDDALPYPITWEREPFEAAGPDLTATLGLELPAGDWREESWRDESWPDEDWPPRRPRRGRWRAAGGGGGARGARGGRGRWLMVALVAVAGASTGAALVLTGGSSGGQPGGTRPATAPQLVRPVLNASQAAPQGPLTMAQASQVLAAYTSANNAANAQRSDAELATIETGSSYAIDAGVYRMQQAENQAPYPAFGPQSARYYIPRETGYPRWFVVQVTNADLDSPAKITGSEYLLFTQTAPGAAWKNAVEPYVLAGAATPQVTLGAGGLATPVTAATPLAVPLGQIAEVTAVSLNGSGPLPNPGNLADLMDQAFWRGKLTASLVTDEHAPASDGVFGLATADGGALLFYTDVAELSLTAPGGDVMRLTIPGYYSASQAVSAAGIGYLEQFATYDPPSGGSGLRVVADYSGITAAN